MTKIITIGNYSGMISPDFSSDAITQQLTNIRSLLASNECKRISYGPDYVVRAQLTIDGNACDVAIKVFKRQSFLKDRYDFKHKSKAERSYRAARHLVEHGISTPAPIAWLERWDNKRLIESYYVCCYEQSTCFRDELAHIYRDLRDNEPLIELLHKVAPAIRAMHDVGFMHGDLGNQNILLPKDNQDHWLPPSFIDLNRCKISTQSLSQKDRAFDISRIILPGDYLRIFKWIYHNHQSIPQEFEKYDSLYRTRFERHRKSRKYRHPLRHLKNRHKKPTHPTYPRAQDIWLWDEKSAQPMISLSKKEKNKQRNFKETLRQTWRTLCLAPRIYREYRQNIQRSFNESRSMDQRIGIALNPKSNYIEPELQLLAQLGNPPVLIRFCHHETPADWQVGLELAERLHAQATPFMVALLHDRQAILDPQRWQVFLETVMTQLANKARHFEITHALNRVKWGIWNSDEYAELMRPAFALRERYPAIQLIGPAGIDFEYHSVINALGALGDQKPLAALSHLLYVDRRGAPENKQGIFSTLEKIALLKAVACAHPQSSDKVIISEVNWPLKEGGIWSPTMCPYLRPNWQQNPIGESEEDYANYMLRYLAITLCSGHVEQVFWWRLSAHGYGLVDDLDNFRLRPAFLALRNFLAILGKSTFISKWNTEEDVYALEFNNRNKKIIMAWTTKNASTRIPGFLPDEILDIYGNKKDHLDITQSPIYLIKTDSDLSL